MIGQMHGLFMTLEFPSGIAPGEGGDYNLLTVARDGMERPILRGSALAGALAHAWRRSRVKELGDAEADANVERYFGSALEGEDAKGKPSRLQVANAVLDCGSASPVNVRTHHLRNRHTKVVAKHALFSLEACPPGTKAHVALWLRDDEADRPDSEHFLATLVGLLDGRLTLGGKSARGVGSVKLTGEATHKVYDLASVDGYADWLDDHRAWRGDGRTPPAGAKLAPRAVDGTAELAVRFTLGIPRGQDLLVGDGQGTRFDVEPQRVQRADGSWWWRLPGSSLRGLFRGWMTRLAALDGHAVVDSAEHHAAHAREQKNLDSVSGDELGWCGLAPADRKGGAKNIKCPIAKLFGSLLGTGRIHIPDAFSPAPAPVEEGPPAAGEQLRKHVAVDRISGGAAEGLLFENSVLTSSSGAAPVRFGLTIRIDEPDSEGNEARWLAKTLQALDLGLLRVGSSKSSGRLALVATPVATGSGAEEFAGLRPTARFEAGTRAER